MTASIQRYSEPDDMAVYDAEDISYSIDTGVFIECPGCGKGVTIHRAVDSGCWDHNDRCGRGPWGVTVEV